MEPDPDEEEVEDMRLDDEMESRWRIFFEGNDGGVDNQRLILRHNRPDVYMKKKETLNKCGYYM